MFDSIKLTLRLFGLYARLDLLWFMRDLRYCLLQIFSDSVAALSSVSAVLLVCARFGGVGGMSFSQVLFMCGYAVITDGIIVLFFGGSNIAYISRIIGRGQLDHMLTQPVPIFIQLLTSGFDPFSGNIKLICGIVLTAVAAAELRLPVTPLWVLLLIGSLIASVAVILSATYIVSCLAFYAPVAAEEVSGVMLELFGETKSYPLGGLSKAGAAVFCTILPVGLCAWFPSGVLLGKAPFGFTAALMFIVTAVFCAAASILFKKGIIHYEKYGSTRYSGFGYK